MAKRKPRKARSKSSRPRGPSRASRSAVRPKDAVTLIVVFRAREGQETLLEAELRALQAPSRKEAECFAFDLYRPLDTPGAFLLHEVWGSREAHTEHTHTPHFLRWNARKDALILSRDAAFWKQIT